MSWKYQCVCLLLLVWTLAIEGYKQRRPPGCFRSLRHCRDKCCGNGKTCDSIFYRGCTWYKCSLVDCGTLSDPENGHVTTHPGHTFESTATYSCNDGYELDGQSTRTCLSTSHWSGNQPTCRLVDRFETVIIVTPDVYGYYLIDDSLVNVSGVQSLLFEVQACNDAHILLVQDRTQLDMDLFEVVIGGWNNTRSAIRLTQQGNPIATYNHQDQPLSCDTRRPFWISWSQDSIQVGTGSTIGQAGFLSTSNSQNITINYVAVSTGFGTTGIWTFN